LENICEVLKAGRIKSNYTQNDVAKALFTTRQAVSRWENGHTKPDLDTLHKLCELYEIDFVAFSNQQLETIPVCAPVEHNRTSYTQDQSLMLIGLLCVGAAASPLGLIVAPFVWLKNQKNINPHSKLINVLCVICLICNLWFTYLMLDSIFGWSTVTEVIFEGHR
jgi:transcriptional regulator with XRE-family HTH domain